MFSHKFMSKVLAVVTIFTILLGWPGVARANYWEDLLQKQDELNNTNNQIDEKNAQKQQYANEIDAKNAAIADMEGKISDTSNQIKTAEKEIQRLADEIKKNRAVYEVKKNALYESLRLLYESGTKTALEVIVSSQDLTTLQQISTYHQDLQNRVNNSMKELDELKKTLDNKQADQEKKKKELNDLQQKQQDEKADLERQKQDKAVLLDITKGDISKLEDLRQKEEAEEAALQSKLNAGGGSAYSGPADFGFFASPLPGFPRLSDPCGEFMSSCYFGGMAHYGVDLAADQGTPVFAAAGGTVVEAYYSGSLALSYVAIDHGNGYLTKYLHLSEIWVSQGQVVSKGTTIGLSGGAPGSIGSGWSTGSHLHFEVRIHQCDGCGWEAINPASVISYSGW